MFHSLQVDPQHIERVCECAYLSPQYLQLGFLLIWECSDLLVSQCLSRSLSSGCSAPPQDEKLTNCGVALNRNGSCVWPVYPHTLRLLIHTQPSVLTNSPTQLISTLDPHPNLLAPFPKSLEIGLLPESCLKRSHTLDSLHCRSIQQPHYVSSRLCPQLLWKTGCMEQRTHSLNDRSVAPLRNSRFLVGVMDA